MNLSNRIVLLLIVCRLSAIAGETDTQDFVYLSSLKNDLKNTPPNWVGSDPCSSGWSGIGCVNSRITSITLSAVGLTGHLTGDLGSLSELQTLDLSYNGGLTGTIPSSIGLLTKLSDLILVGCDFFGVIPDAIGALQNLVFLSLNSNRFSGRIPASIGNLTNLYWLDLAENQLEGPLPVSNGSTPGLDLLHHAKHFHLGRNNLSGSIPPQLFSAKMRLIHILLDGNRLTGAIPPTLGLVASLEVVRLDGNMLTGTVPSSLNSLASLGELFLSNNRLTGPIPDLSGLSVLTTLDLSNNSFDESDVPPWVSTLDSLTTLMMQNTGLRGQIPSALFGLPNLQTLVFSNNKVNGTLTLGPTFSNQLQLIDLRGNRITEVDDRGYRSTLILAGNPVCLEDRSMYYFCSTPTDNSSRYSTPTSNCSPSPCSWNETSSPNCICAHPFTGTFVFRAPSFSNLQNSTRFTELHDRLMAVFQSTNLPVNSVSLSEPAFDEAKYLNIRLAVFPADYDRFNRTGVSSVGFVLSNQTFNPPHYYGPFYFMAESYQYFGGETSESRKSSLLNNVGVIIGVAVGGSLLLLLLTVAAACAIRQKKRATRAAAQKNPFAAWDSTKRSGDVPQLKGARWFSFEELKKSTENFSETNEIGAGGYGEVYRGVLPSGEAIAIKRAKKGSMQGGLEFKTEIELLSRVHHRNLVTLLGFCFEQGEQMLVYEYVPNGNLRDTLSGKTGIRLDWMRRLRIALGAARGVSYLHELANPPIIHRDIKSNNILLDDKLNAKVADFGLSKLMPNSDVNHVTTQVKGTMGYLDPEYYMTQQLTEKSDVYGFGVLMLELITARKPIERGKYIVREVQNAMDKTKPLYNLDEILDLTITTSSALQGLEKFVDLALRCVEETGANRPTMGEVVKEIESIMVIAGLNPNAESASASASYEEASTGSGHHPYTNREFGFVSGSPSPNVDP